MHGSRHTSCGHISSSYFVSCAARSMKPMWNDHIWSKEFILKLVNKWIACNPRISNGNPANAALTHMVCTLRPFCSFIETLFAMPQHASVWKLWQTKSKWESAYKRALQYTHSTQRVRLIHMVVSQYAQDIVVMLCVAFYFSSSPLRFDFVRIVFEDLCRFV